MAIGIIDPNARNDGIFSRLLPVQEYLEILNIPRYLYTLGRKCVCKINFCKKKNLSVTFQLSDKINYFREHDWIKPEGGTFVFGLPLTHLGLPF